MIIKKRNFSKKVLDKPVSPAYVYYTKYGDNKIRKITIKTLLRKINKISFSKRWYQTIREAQKSLDK